jgi:hypothetical protein
MTLVDPPSSRWTRWEWPLLLAILAAFLVLNIATASRSPTIWCDEAMITDPPANMYLGHGFHSAAFTFITKEKTYISNGMLYEGALYLWLRVFGLSPTAVRSLNYFLMAVGVSLYYIAVKRTNVISTARGRIAFACLLLCSYSITFAYRSGRYDILGMNEAGALYLAYTLRRPWLRYTLLAILGAMLMWTGVPIASAAGAISLALLIVMGWRIFPAVLATGVGSVIGLATLLAALKRSGVLEAQLEFTKNVATKDVVGGSSSHIIHHTLQVIFAGDFSMLPLLLLFLLALFLVNLKQKSFPRTMLFFGLLISILVPLGMCVAGHYPIYYMWMTFIPAAIAAVSLWEIVLRQNPRAAVRCTSLALIIVACAIGLPARMSLLALEWKQRDYAPVESLVDANLTPTDWVYCDFAAYYPAKLHAELVFLQGYFQVMSPEEKQRINVLIIDPETIDAVREQIGGNWRDTGQHLAPVKSANLFGMHRKMGARLYNLTVYRRIPA